MTDENMLKPIIILKEKLINYIESFLVNLLM